jgi:hypothetical protein
MREKSIDSSDKKSTLKNRAADALLLEAAAIYPHAFT